MDSLTATENTINTIKINANFATRLLDSMKSLTPKPPLDVPDEETPASLGFEKLDVIPFKNPPPSVSLSFILSCSYYYNLIKKQSFQYHNEWIVIRE